jgi:peptide/nickel transport system permease protein
MRFLRPTGRKFAILIATLLAVSFLVFMLTSLLPGNAAIAILGVDNITTKGLRQVDAQLGLGHPLPYRYGLWLWHLVHGNLGYSFISSRAVNTELATALPVTVEIIILAIAFALICAIPIGIRASLKPGKAFDVTASTSAFVLISVPTFVTSLLLILLFAVDIKWFPASGWVPLTQNLTQNLRSAVLPALALSLPQIAIFSRILRGDMVATLNEDFIALGRVKGISTLRLVVRHALRPSSFSLITLAGLQIGFLLGGTVIVENIFALPGIGQLLINAINDRDLPTVQGVTLFIATTFVVVNFLVDLSYSLIDPRIRRGGAALTGAPS